MDGLVLLNTPLGHDLMYTTYVRALAIGVGGELSIEYDSEKNTYYIGLQGVSINKIIEKSIKVLYGMREQVGSLRASIPLIVGGPGTDADHVYKILGVRPTKRSEYRGRFYDSVIEYLRRDLGGLAYSLSIENYLARVDGNLVHMYGGSRAQYPAPSIYKHEILYELGRFGGLRDYTIGRPSIGRVEIRVAPELYMYLTALAMAYEVYAVRTQQGIDRVYLSLVPIRTRLNRHRAAYLEQVFENIIKWIRDTHAARLYGEPDVFTLALSYWLYVIDRDGALANIGFRLGIHVFSEGRRRFQKKHYVYIDNSLLRTTDLGLKRLGLKRVDRIDLARVLAYLLISTHLLAIDTGSSTYQRIACYTRNIALGIMGLSPKALLDQIYDLNRLLSDQIVRTRVLGKLAGVMGIDTGKAREYLDYVFSELLGYIH